MKWEKEHPAQVEAQNRKATARHKEPTKSETYHRILSYGRFWAGPDLAARLASMPTKGGKQ